MLPKLTVTYTQNVKEDTNRKYTNQTTLAGKLKTCQKDSPHDISVH